MIKIYTITHLYHISFETVTVPVALCRLNSETPVQALCKMCNRGSLECEIQLLLKIVNKEVGSKINQQQLSTKYKGLIEI